MDLRSLKRFFHLHYSLKWVLSLASLVCLASSAFVKSNTFQKTAVATASTRLLVPFGNKCSIMSSTGSSNNKNLEENSSINNDDDVVHPACLLPGDPSLILTTNIDLGSKKMDIMKAISKAIVKNMSKPEQWVSVCINDKADLIFAGTDAPAALGTFCSLGAINKENNGGLTADVTDLLAEFGLDEGRIYINFFDIDRANIGWSRKTFAG